MDAQQANPGNATQFTIGSIFSQSLSTLFKNPLLFFGLVFLSLLPAMLLATLPVQATVLKMITSIISNILGLVFQAAIAYGAFQAMRNKTATFGEAIKQALSRLLPLVGASILVGFATGVGMLLLVVPGVILMCIWAVTIQSCVVEKLGAVDSMKRSADLTKGYRWTVFAAILIMALINMAVMFAGIFILTRVTQNTAVIGIFANLLIIVPAAFNSVMMAIIYYDLRAVKEGLSIDSLASVFD